MRFNCIRKAFCPSQTLRWLHLMVGGIFRALASTGMWIFWNRNCAKHPSSLKLSMSNSEKESYGSSKFYDL